MTEASAYTEKIRAAKMAALTRFVAALNDPSISINDLSRLATIWKATESAYPEHRYSGVEPAVMRAILADFVEEVSLHFSELPDLRIQMIPHFDAIINRIYIKRMGEPPPG